MTAAFPLFLIPLLPLLGAAFALCLGRRVGKNIVMLVSCGTVAAAALVAFKAVWLLGTELPPGGTLSDAFFAGPWIKAGDLTVSAGLVLDHLSSVLVLVVTGIGFLIHVYSTAYMEHDEGYTRFFGYLNLFTGAMLILVLGDSLPVTFVGWEGVGLCSYLLIGFWFDKDANALAGRKAFVVNRVGDFAMLAAMFLIFQLTGTLKYSDLAGKIEQLSTPLWFGLPAAYFIGLLVLGAATGKSAQIPLYVWLPDAMAGPTPVSALIHAATMVTAGVYVVARLHLVFQLSPATLGAVAAIGAATALFAATIGLLQRDMKKVLAYSTISQLGFMFAAVGSYVFVINREGTSNYQAGIFHLATHAFFKAGLFLGAGSVMHALDGEGDITRMGGLKKYLPHTRWTFLICCLAIAGIFPFAGFWSKDAILAGAEIIKLPLGSNPHALERFFAENLGHIVHGLLLAAAACTAFYMFRLYFLVFEGEYRGDPEHHPHESPPAMTVVLWVLALGSIAVGLSGVPDGILLGEHSNYFGAWLDPVLTAQLREESAHEFWKSASITLSISGGAIGLAWMIYGGGLERARGMAAALPRLHRLISNKYYVDEIYDWAIVRPLRALSFLLWNVVDRFFIDLLLVNGVGFLVTGVGKLVKYAQNGDVQRYIVGIIAGTAAVLYLATNYSACSATKIVRLDHAGREVTVAARGAGPSDKRLQYRIDWNSDDKWTPPQSLPTFKHQYESDGKKKITVETIDPRWGTTSRDTMRVVLP